MKNRKHFFIVTLVLLSTLFALSIGAQLKQEVTMLTQLTKENSETQVRHEMENLLKVTRESVTQVIEKNDLDVTDENSINIIIEQSIKPLNIESVSGNVVLMQVQPTFKILYQKKDGNVPQSIIDTIKVGIDSSIQENATYNINNESKVAEWVGIPPGIKSFDSGNIKWVLLIEKDKSYLNEITDNLVKIQTAIVYRLYLILFISCLVVVTTVITIYHLQNSHSISTDEEDKAHTKKE